MFDPQKLRSHLCAVGQLALDFQFVKDLIGYGMSFSRLLGS